MVYLNRIYTKSGDEGTTSLGDGSRVSKTDPRIVAYGGVDELNSVIGVARAAGLPQRFDAWLASIQNDLFDLGADLCVPEPPASTRPDSPAAESRRSSSSDATPSPDAQPASRSQPLRVAAGQVVSLEQRIDELTAELTPLTSFVLPGGTPAAAHLHHARTVCRRVEIGVIGLAAHATINAQAAIYLNRLSDLLFVMARMCNGGGADDVLWVPGASRPNGP